MKVDLILYLVVSTDLGWTPEIKRVENEFCKRFGPVVIPISRDACVDIVDSLCLVTGHIRIEVLLAIVDV